MAEDARISPEVVEIALEKAEGFAFERFANEFLSSVEGRKFSPLGGKSDGAADGFSFDELFETEKAGLFYQITIEKNHRDKIKRTINRLREFGRSPRILYYITSKLIAHIDREEDELTEEHDVIVKIRDKNYIVSRINQSLGTVSAFKNHLERYTEFLARIGKADLKGIQHVDDPSVYVFLQHEVSNRLGNRKLVHSITDTLILWALRETSPEKKVFMNRESIYKSIIAHFPWSSSFLNAHLDYRLSALRTKDSQGRQLRWYPKQSNSLEGKYGSFLSKIPPGGHSYFSFIIHILC